METQNTNGLIDDDKNFVVPLMVVGIVVVVLLLGMGMFMPSTDWIF
jgi:hypothetical protein